VNRNTRSIALDLSTSEGCLAAKTLVLAERVGLDPVVRIPTSTAACSTMEVRGESTEDQK